MDRASSAASPDCGGRKSTFPDPFVAIHLSAPQPSKAKLMKDTHQFQLIDGTFRPEDASRVLLSLVDRKMDYHRAEKFSNEERFGRDSSHSEKRLGELARLKEALSDLLASAETGRQNVAISGRIEITLLPAGGDGCNEGRSANAV